LCQAQPLQPASPPPKDITASTPAQIGAAILAARTTAGLPQNDLAAKLKTAQQNVQRLEKGGSIPSTNTLLRIAKATGHKLVLSFDQCVNLKRRSTSKETGYAERKPRRRRHPAPTSPNPTSPSSTQAIAR
jgi:transcriptional regulator with XRE-family HTH domain